MDFKNPYNLGLLFESQVKRTPTQVAIRWVNGESVTYQALNARANQIARFLQTKGVQPQDRVAIFNHKTRDAYATMLACLKIGAIYLNLDDSNPIDRLSKMWDAAAPKVLCFENALPLGWRQDLCPAIGVDYGSPTFLEEIASNGVENLSETLAVHGNQVAYVMFTSGSTGFPKGAAMTHQNVLHFIDWAQSRFEVTPQDTLANVNPIYFDNSVFDFYTAIFSGATLGSVPHSLLKKPKELVAAMETLGCTIWFSVPSLLLYLLNLRLLKPSDFPTVRRIIFGGEAFPKPKLKQLFDLFSSRIRFTNVYGPTECTCICTAYEVGAQDFSTLEGILPLGAMNPNFGFLILDDSGRPVSQGELGELCLLGPCVGRGYYGQMELTAKAFKQNPNQSHLTEWMYCTGDLVVQHPKTQTLHFVARKDNQIKYQGYRIELDEIESAFYTLPYVNEAAVIYIQDPESPPGKIKAVVSVQGEIDESRIIQDLRARLPEYMLPRRIFFQSELPKNKNGKVDRVTLTREYEVA